MQKMELSTMIRQELIRALIFGLGFFAVLFVGFTGVAYAANGGAFGEILNKILASGNWEAAGDGTVKNAAKFDNKNPSAFVQVATPFSCPANQCIYKLTNGVPECR